jgi:ATP-dependent DNA ligase
VAFDVLAIGSRSLMAASQAMRRQLLEDLLKPVKAPVHLTPVTRAPATARKWLARFEGAGLDGVVAKLASEPYQPGKRIMLKVKHSRTADCVVAGFRWYTGSRDAIGSLLLGLYTEQDELQHVGVCSSFSIKARQELLKELDPLRRDGARNHPWLGHSRDSAELQRVPGAPSRWSTGKDLSWEPLKPCRVCEVRYDHLQGARFRHAAFFLRWRPDKKPRDCRYDQLEVAEPFALQSIL